MSIAQKLKDRLKQVEAGEDAGPPLRDEGVGEVKALDFGRPIFINPNAGPVEYLVSRGELENGKDPEGMGGTRFHTALRFRDLIDGAQVKGIRSPDWSSTGGGSAGSAGDIRGYQLDCLTHISAIRSAMPRPWVFELLERVVWRDDWLDLVPVAEKDRTRRERKRKQRLKTIETLHWALDLAALQLGYLHADEFRRRWLGLEPKPSPEARRRIRVSKA